MAQDSTISFKPDELMKKHGEWATAEAADSSRAGTRREAIGAYREGAGLEAKAFSQFRAGMKIKDPAKKKDWIRSLRHLVEVAEAEIFANEPDLPLEADDAADAAADEANDMAEEAGVGDDDYDPTEVGVGEHVEAEDAETAEFNAAVDEAVDADVVTPINLGGDAA